MMSKIFYWVLTFLPLVLVCVAYPWMSDTVAVHFGIDGEPDRWMDRWGIFLIPVLVVVFSLLMRIISRLSAKNSVQPNKNNSVTQIMMIAALVTFNIATIWAIVTSLPVLHTYTAWIDFHKLVYLCLGIALIPLGILLPQLTRNNFSGAKVPWKLSDVMWSRLQFFARKVSIAGGILMTVLCGVLLSNQNATIVAFAIMAVMVILILLYGYYLRRISKKELRS